MTQINTNILTPQDQGDNILTPNIAAPVPKIDNSAPVLGTEPDMRRFGDVSATRQAIYGNTMAALTEMEPTVGKTHTLRMVNPKWSDPEMYSKARHKQAVLAGESLGRRIKATWELLDNATGEVVDSRQQVVGRAPYLTQHGTFVHNGNEYAIKNQQRLRPGLFTRVKNNGEIETHANVLDGGASHRYFLDPEKGVFYIRAGQSKIPLLPLMRELGATDDEIQKAWGRDIFATNYSKADASHLVKLKEKFGREGKTLREVFEGMTLDPDVTSRTMGAPYDRLNKDAVLSTTKKLLNVSKGESEPDDRDHLAYQTFLGPEDLIAERLRRDRAGVRRQLLYKAVGRGNLGAMPSSALQQQIDSTILESGLGQSLEEINPAEIFDKQTQISRLGEGGIPSLDAIPDESRAVQPSHMGFMDPLRTPECYDSETEVMTKDGWLPWPSVTGQEKLACLVDGRLEFHRPDKVVQYDYVGQMCGASTSLIDYLVTPDHRMYVRRGHDTPHWRIETADQTHESHVRLFKCGGHEPSQGVSLDPGLPEFDSRSNNSKPVDLSATPLVDWAEFVGWYLSEGNLSVCEDRQSYRIVLTQCPKANPENHRRIVELLDRLPFNWSYCNLGKAFVVSRRHLYEWAKPFGKCDDKYIPDVCFDWPEDARRALLSGLLLGDGRKSVKGSRVGEITQYCSTSRRLAYDVQRLLFTLGLSSRIVFEPDEREDRYLGCWVVHIHSRDMRQVSRAHASKTSDYRLEIYNGKVYCASVPGGLLYVRRNGKCGIWCGNSARVGVDVHMARNARKGRDGKIYGQFKTKTGDLVWKTPQEAADLVVGFPGSAKSDAPMVPAMKNGRITYVKQDDIDMEMPHFENAFSGLGNLVPIKSMVKGQRVAMASRMSVTGDSWVLVLRADGSAYHGKIADYVWQQGDRSPSIDKTTHRLEWKPVRAKIKHRNTKKLLRVCVGSGRSVIATEDHSFVTLGESGRLKKIRTGQLRKDVPVPYAAVLDCPEAWDKCWEIPAGNKHNAHPAAQLPLTRDLGWFLGLYVAEGYGAGKTPRAVTIANIDLEVQARVCRFAASCGVTAKPSSGRDDGVNDRVVISWLQLYLKLHNDFGDGAYNKKIPAWVIFSPKPFREGFISGYMAGDGIVSKPVARSTTTGGGSRSEDLVRGLTMLCASLGISTSVSASWVDTGPGGSRVQQHKFTIRKEHQHLLPLIGHPGKDKKLERFSWSGKRSYDWIPIFDDLRPMFNRRTRRRDKYRRRLDNRHMGRLDRRSVIDVFGDDTSWATRGWSESSVWWDRVATIEPVDAEHEFVYDLDMEDNVFMANGVFVHNTTQALPLQGAETPLVQGAIPGGDGKSFEQEYGTKMGAVRAEQGGRVLAVSDDEIEVEYADGRKDKVELFNNMPFNRKTAVHQTATVKPGQRFNPGDLLVRSNFTDDKGSTALGLNARVAYIPWKGSNFEDAILISEGMAKRLTSEHMYQHDLELTDKHKTGKKAFIGLFPSKYDKKTLANLDDEGLVKPGTVLNYGDPMILAAQEKSTAANKVHKKGKAAFNDASVTWNHHDSGVVTDVVNGKSGPVVLVKSKHPMQVGDKLCYDPETSLLTRRGWKPVAEITLDDELATLNPETDELEYRRPTHVHSFEHAGDMYYLNTKHLNMLVTPEHRLWVARPGQAYGAVTAKDFYESQGEWQFKKDCKWVGEERLLMEFDPYDSKNSREQVLESVPMDIWLRFLGYYLSEGRTCRTSNGGYQVQISQFRTSTAWEAIHDTLVELGLRFSYRENENRFEINSKWLYGILLPFGHDAYSKRVPEYVQELCSRQISIFFDSYMEGDGHKGACWEFGSSSEQLAVDIQVLCLKLGWCVSLKLSEREDSFQKNPHWRGRVNRNHLRPWWKKGRAKTYVSNEEKMVQYDGKVYCVTVPNHVVYCKREDKTYWSLNSGRYG